jgi:formylmethanofuran--tetrahydromethanopterin N-formyltransferase
MIINGVAIDNAFAEAFGMKATRIHITAHNLEWAYHAANAATGFATSVIACGCEAGIERELGRAETADGRPAPYSPGAGRASRCPWGSICAISAMASRHPR